MISFFNESESEPGLTFPKAFKTFLDRMFSFSESEKINFAQAFQKAFEYEYKPVPMANYRPHTLKQSEKEFHDLHEQESTKQNDWRFGIDPAMVDWIILVTETRLRHDHAIMEDKIQSVKRKLEQGKIVEVTIEELRFQDQPAKVITLPMSLVPEFFKDFKGITLPSDTPVEDLPPIPAVANA